MSVLITIAYKFKHWDQNHLKIISPTTLWVHVQTALPICTRQTTRSTARTKAVNCVHCVVALVVPSLPAQVPLRTTAQARGQSAMHCRAYAREITKWGGWCGVEVGGCAKPCGWQHVYHLVLSTSLLGLDWCHPGVFMGCHLIMCCDSSHDTLTRGWSERRLPDKGLMLPMENHWESHTLQGLWPTGVVDRIFSWGSIIRWLQSNVESFPERHVLLFQV